MPLFGSPRVQVSEYDISQYVAGPSASIGVIVIRAKRGQVVPRFVTNTRQFKELYTRTQSRIDQEYVEQYAAIGFLEVGYSGLWVVRAVGDNAKYSYIIVNKSDAEQAVIVPSTGLSVDEERTGPVFPEWGDVGADAVMIIYSKSPGTVGDNLKVLIQDVQSASKTFRLTVIEELPDGSQEVRFDGVCSLDPEAKDGYGNNIWVKNLLENNEYVGAEVNSQAYSLVPKEIESAVNLAGGVDDEATVGDIGSAYDRFMNKEEWDIDLLIHGGIGGDTIRTKLVQIAETRGDCVALLDVDVDKVSVEDLVSWRKGTFLVGSSYGMLFAPVSIP